MASSLGAIPSRIISRAPQPSANFWWPCNSKWVRYRWGVAHVNNSKTCSPIRGDKQPLLGNRMNEVNVIVIEYRTTASGVRLGGVSAPSEYFPTGVITSNPRVESVWNIEYLSSLVERSTAPFNHFRIWIGPEKEQAAFLIRIKSTIPVTINR